MRRVTIACSSRSFGDELLAQEAVDRRVGAAAPRAGERDRLRARPLAAHQQPWATRPRRPAAWACRRGSSSTTGRPCGGRRRPVMDLPPRGRERAPRGPRPTLCRSPALMRSVARVIAASKCSAGAEATRARSGRGAGRAGARGRRAATGAGRQALDHVVARRVGVDDRGHVIRAEPSCRDRATGSTSRAERPPPERRRRRARRRSRPLQRGLDLVGQRAAVQRGTPAATARSGRASTRMRSPPCRAWPARSRREVGLLEVEEAVALGVARGQDGR